MTSLPAEKAGDGETETEGQPHSTAKDILNRFAGKTAMHGWSSVRESRFPWLKIVWVVLTLVAVAALGAHAYYLCKQYYAWPLSTKVSLEFNQLMLPAITICNVNVMKKSFISHLEGSVQLKKFVDFMSPESLMASPADGGAGDRGKPANRTRDAPSNTTVLHRQKRFIGTIEAANLTEFDADKVTSGEPDDDALGTEEDQRFLLEEVFARLYMGIDKSLRAEGGHTISDMLLNCHFRGHSCFPENFTLHQSQDYGNCWTFSSTRFIVNNPGYVGGLSMLLYLENEEFLDGITNGHGARLVIHEPGSFAFPGTDGIFIAAATETSIGLKQKSITRLHEPYGECEVGEAFALKYGFRYTREACRLGCKLALLLDECGCHDDLTEQLATALGTNKTRCDTDTEIKCMFTVLRKYLKNRSICNCLNPCRDVEYYKTVSSRQWPTNSYASVLQMSACEKHPSMCEILRNESKDPRNLAMNFLKVNIYYESLNYEDIEEQPEIPYPTFISNIGGALGMWIGLSILTLCEIIQLLIELTIYMVRKLSDRRT